MLLQVKNGDGGGNGGYGNIQTVRYPQCTLFHQAIEGGEIVVTYHGALGGDEGQDPESALRVPLEPSIEGLPTVPVKLFNSAADVYRMGEPYDSWFSARFGYPVILVYIGDSRRPVLAHLPGGKGNDPKDGVPAQSQQQQQRGWLSTIASYVMGGGQGEEEKAPDNKFLTFNEAAPYLVTSRVSLRDLNSRLPEGEDADMVVMRSNIVVDDNDGGGEQLQAWEEDYWGELQIRPSGSGAGAGDAEGPRLVLTANCGRCQSLNIDYATGRPAEGQRGQVLKKLMADRRVDQGNKWAPIFGRYAFLQPPAPPTREVGGANDAGDDQDIVFEVAVGDEVEVTRRNEERDVWRWPMK